jgi:DAPG hydrolase PhiG domain
MQSRDRSWSSPHGTDDSANTRPTASGTPRAAGETTDIARAFPRRRLLAAGAGVGAAVTLAGAPSAARAAATCERRYLHYQSADLAKPYAKYMKPHVDPPQAHVTAVAAAPPVAAGQVPPRNRLGAELANPGYAPIETGYGRASNGELWVACLTDMPRVEPAMWDWWFGWHSKESARYKLWHPDAHAYAALRDDTTDRAGLTDRQRYRGNVSYVDEYIGGSLDQLAISFVDPAKFGIDERKIDGTVIAGYVGSAYLPVNLGLVVHAVRRTPTGSEMRSRFYLNVPGLRWVDRSAIACAISRGLVLPSSAVFPVRFGAQLLRHCGEEMNHLAGFLPELHAEFS